KAGVLAILRRLHKRRELELKVLDVRGLANAARHRKEDFLEIPDGWLLGVESARVPAPNEHERTPRRNVAKPLVGHVTLADDLARKLTNLHLRQRLDAEGLPYHAETVPLGLRRTTHPHHSPLARLVLAGSHDLTKHQRKRVFQNDRRLAGFHRLDQIIELRR